MIHLGAVNSDHCPLLINTCPTDVRAPRPFCFEAMWANDPRCLEVVKIAWQKETVGNDCFKLCKKQFLTTSALRKWNKDIFGHCQARIAELTTEIERIQCEITSETNIILEAKLQKQLNVWLCRNETM